MTSIAIRTAAAAALASLVSAPGHPASQAGGQSPPLTDASGRGAAPRVATWEVRGHRSVRPAGVSDDGVRTYLDWGVAQSLPAVFAIGPTGAEEVVDGHIRDGVFMIDRVHSKLVFRIDRARAVATRRVLRR